MTYKQLFEQTKNDAKTGSRMAVAQLLAVRNLMNANGPDAQVDQNAVANMATNFMARAGFRKVMDDPDSKELWEAGNASELMNRIQDYELPSPTYWRTMQNLKANAQNADEATAAQMLAVSIIMDSEDAHSMADTQRIERDSQKLQQQTAFKNLMKDPKAMDLVKAGKHHELMILLAEKQAEVDHQFDDYKRTPNQLNADKQILEDYLRSTTGTAKAGNVELEGKSARYREMIKQIEQAQSLLDQGIPLTGEQNKALCTAIRNYNDNGSKIAGGRASLNQHYTQNMTVLKQLSPVKEFNQYCREIQEAHPRTRETRPENFVPGRLNGTVKTAGELKDHYKKELQHGFSENAVAAVCAINKLSKGDKYFTISQAQLQKEVSKMLEHGSAFRRVMTNGEERKNIQALTNGGNMNQVAKTVQEYSTKHAIGSAQWHMNRAAGALYRGNLNRYNAETNLAMALASYQKAAASKDPSVMLDNKSFAADVDKIRSSKDFQTMVDRYVSDPQYRSQIQKGLQKESGKALETELNKIAHPKEARQQPAQPQA